MKLVVQVKRSVQATISTLVNQFPFHPDEPFLQMLSACIGPKTAHKLLALLRFFSRRIPIYMHLIQANLPDQTPKHSN